MAVKPTQRKHPPRPPKFEVRRTWGGRLLVELNAIKKTPEWLGVRIGYSTPSSMRQVINGHQGISREVYEKILKVMPEMRGVSELFNLPLYFQVEEQGLGAYGKHKPHEYPPIGSPETRRAGRVNVVR